ncbi:hypothetical protein PC118_g20344 [Phytophthora cactorum]|uniref:Uncharacterized protein n=1 Tax=Phytophthora cactorum TaxID=29920 RepID=A0A8T1ASF0_9STRA|nr:hypothetical protein PC115_g20196 [Phytophthora cactorum]KAG2964387.1 hypothetical protein PC118_g20344 [Phytophthora cactorum]
MLYFNVVLEVNALSLVAPLSNFRSTRQASCLGEATARTAVVKVARCAIARLSVTTSRVLLGQQSTDFLVELVSFASRASYTTRLALC